MVLYGLKLGVDSQRLKTIGNITVCEIAVSSYKSFLPHFNKFTVFSTNGKRTDKGFG